MKAFALFLAFVLLACMVLPCCAINCDETIEKTAELPFASERNHQDSNCKQPCSPFYTCNSCMSVIIITSTGDISSFITSIEQSVLDFCGVKQPTDLQLAIWQPPKLNT